MPRRTLLPLLVTAGALAAAAPASADTLYAAPGSNNAVTCSEQDPCGIDGALANAGNGDDILVLPGTHVRDAANGPAFMNAGVHLHGAPGQPRPTITQSGPYGNCNCPVIFAFGGHVSDVRIEQPGVSAGALGLLGSTDVTRAELIGGNGAYVTSGSGGEIRDSVVHATAPNGVGLLLTSGADADAVSSTVVASGTGGTAVRLDTSGFNPVTFGLHEAVLHGAGLDADVVTQNMKAATLEADHSVLRTAATTTTGSGAQVVDGGGNVDAAPAFADLAAGDLRLAAGSAGIDDGAGPGSPTDLDGRARGLGAGIDAGAYEFRPAPTVATGAVSGVGQAGATVAGTVDPEDAATQVRVQYGPTVAYGQQTAALAVPAGTDPVAVSRALTGLQPGTTHHARVVATNATGTSYGQDVTFTTAPAPAAPGGDDDAPVDPDGPGQDPSDTDDGPSGTDGTDGGDEPARTLRPRFGSLRRLAADRRGRVRILVRCPAAAERACRGTLRFRVAGRTVRARVRVRAGAERRVTVRLPRPARTRLAALEPGQRLRARATLTVRDAAGARGVRRAGARILVS